MSFENITMNLSALNDITAPNLSVSNDLSWIDVVLGAEASSDGYLIFGSMFVFLIIIYYLLSDKSPIGDFGFDDIRALNIALSICTLFASTIVSVGWSKSFFSIGMFGTGWFVTFVIILIYTNRE